MKKILALILISLACSKKEVDRRSDCVDVEQINIASSCYDETKGLTLTADTPSSLGLEWVIAPLKDTSGAQTYIPYYVSSPSNQITLPDSLLRKYPKIGIAYVGAYECGSKFYFSFVKRTDKDSSCVRWFLQERFIQED